MTIYLSFPVPFEKGIIGVENDQYNTELKSTECMECRTALNEGMVYYYASNEYEEDLQFLEGDYWICEECGNKRIQK